jgi:hypothetical protein
MRRAGLGEQFTQHVFAEAAAGQHLGIDYLQFQQAEGGIQFAFQSSVDQGRPSPLAFHRDRGVSLRLDARDLLGA